MAVRGRGLETEAVALPQRAIGTLESLLVMRSSFLPFARPSLPLFPGLTDADQEDVVAAVREILSEFQR